MLVSEEVGTLPEQTLALLLERIDLSVGALLSAQETAGPEQLLVVSGEVLIQDAFGFSMQLGVDEGTAILPGAAYELENLSMAEAVVLRLRVAGESGPPEDPASASPSDSASSTGPSVVIDSLARAELTGTLPDPAALYFGRATWEPGAQSEPLGHTGPVGLYVIAGELSVTSPSGIEGRVSSGNAVVVPSETPFQAHNEGTESATAYLFGIHEPGSPVFTTQMTGPAPAITTTPTLTPIAIALSTPSPSEPANTPTPRVVSSPIPLAEAGQVLYEANSATGFAGWSGAEGWQDLDDMLIADGTNSDSGFVPIFAPYQTAPSADYAVEAEIRKRNAEGASFGIAVSSNGSETGYAVGIGEGSGPGWQSAVFLLDGTWGIPDEDGLVAQGQYFDPGDQWHTYRVAVSGNTIQLFIDGLIMVTATVDRPGTGERIGLWSSGSELEVRDFRVIALGSGEDERVDAAAPSPEQAPAPLPTAEAVVPTPTADVGTGSGSGFEQVATVLTFAYDDWVSGWRQDGNAWYGRPWTVVYGAFSNHPRATLSFTLDSPQSGSSVLEVAGLDDEWAGNCEINILVNGVSVFAGANPWLSYSGTAADFSDAPWTSAAFDIPAGLLTAGSNTIVIENLEAAANFGTPPYILLGDTTLRLNAAS
jgi:mannose-6-phosphate isomerase-like protein (cupin superfamily)